MVKRRKYKALGREKSMKPQTYASFGAGDISTGFPSLVELVAGARHPSDREERDELVPAVRWSARCAGIHRVRRGTRAKRSPIPARSAGQSRDQAQARRRDRTAVVGHVVGEERGP